MGGLRLFIAMSVILLLYLLPSISSKMHILQVTSHVHVHVCDSMFENSKGQKTYQFLNKFGYHESKDFVFLILAQNSSTFSGVVHCHLILKSTLISKTPIKGSM